MSHTPDNAQTQSAPHMRMNTIIYLVSRVIQLLANITKGACYVFHFCFPRKRFTLPSYAPPLLKSKRPSNIPKTIWQTNFTNTVTLPIYINYLFNRIMAPTHEYRFMITQQRADFIQSNYPQDTFENYSKLQIGAAQADFWRLLVLQKHGGVYLDIDGHLLWPLNLIIKSNHNELFITMKNGKYTNFFIASRPDSPHLEKMIQLVARNIQQNTIKSIIALTGPKVVDDVLAQQQVNSASYRHVARQGNFTNEYFQYIDKPEGKWTRSQHHIDVVKS